MRQRIWGAPFCLAYPHNTGPGGCCGFYQPSFELVNSFQVDANGLPYLNGEYRTKKSVSVRNSDSSQDAVLAVNDNNIAVDPRLDFAVGRFGILIRIGDSQRMVGYEMLRMAVSSCRKSMYIARLRMRLV